MITFAANSEKSNMTLHLFNPDHDLALASGLTNFTAPHAGRQLRHDLAFLPALWAAPGDIVLVDDDTEQQERMWMKVMQRLHALPGHKGMVMAQPQFVGLRKQLNDTGADSVEPWGWNAALCAQLRRRGIGPELMPDEERLQAIRQLSHRATAVALLPQLQQEGTTGQSALCHSIDEVTDTAQSYGGRVVLKAPWSSSGRGLRFCNLSQPCHTQQRQNEQRWTQHVIEQQGAVVVEPYYNKVKDFGMEFVSDAQGQAQYMGLSLFHTQNGAYTGNLLATEHAKRSILERMLEPELIDNVQQRLSLLLGQLCRGVYSGPLGVDMMVVTAGGRQMLHPCVEVNLRRTMGHVALALSPTDDDDEVRQVMRIDYEDQRYKLRIRQL